MSEGLAADDRWPPDPTAPSVLAADEWDPAWYDESEPPVGWEDKVAGDLAPPVAGWTGEGEAFAAGFLHRDLYEDVPFGVGFASGGLFDQLPAGPGLARLIANAMAPEVGGPTALGESELIGVLCAWRRIASWAAAGQAAAVNTLVSRRAAQAIERDNRNLFDHVGDEIAAALTLTGRAGSVVLAESAGLARLPEVHQYLCDGWIDQPKAAVFTAELSVLPADDAARAIAARVLPDAPSLTTGQLRALLRRLVLAVDPDALEKRKAEAARDAEVALWTETSGNAALAGRELPEADALSADRRLTALARWLTVRGAEGSLGQLRAAVFTALLNGRSVQSLLPEDASPDTSAVGTIDGCPANSGVANSGPAYNGPACNGPACSGPACSGPACSGPACSGPACSGPAGDVLAGLAGLAGASGRADLAVLADWATASAPPVTGTIHLTMPLSTWMGLTSSAGEVAGYGPVPASTSRELASMLADSRSTRSCLTLTGPAGEAVAHACGPPGHGPPPGPSAWQWAERLARKLSYLQTAECQHLRAEHRYRPSRSLAHLIRIRQRRCSFPGCRRPAYVGDLDHTIAYDQGGLTCECNLAPLCRHHHRAKQAPGWHLSQDQPGHMTWRLPHGRQYAAVVEPYPT